MHKGIWFAFLIVAMDMMAGGIIWPTLPTLLAELTGLERVDTVTYSIGLMVAFSAMQFLFGAFIGNLSDRYGRRPIVLLAMATLAVDYFIMAFAPTVWVLFVGRLIAGVAGATFAVGFAIAADVSKPENKAQAMGMIGAAFGLGFTLGPALGGIVGEHLGPRAPFMVASGLAALTVCAIYFYFEETLGEDKRRSFDLKRANPVGALGKILEMPALAWLILIYFLSQTAGMVYPAIWNYWSIAVFDWSESMIGYSLAVVGICSACVQGGLIGPINKALGEYRTAILGMVCTIAGMLALSVLQLEILVWPLIFVTTMGGLTQPAIQAILSNQRSASEQGELQGIMSSLAAIASIITPLTAGGLFWWFNTREEAIGYPGVSFLGASMIQAIALILLLTMVGTALRARAKSA